MKQLILLMFFVFGMLALDAQQTGKVLNPDFDQEISEYLSFSIPIIGVEEFKKLKDESIVLDARERNEFEVSHIPGAKYIGYDDFDLDYLKDLDRDQRVILYCSIGYRSEKLGEKLKKAGFKKVYNLYGSIFEWANQGNPLEDLEGKPTQQLHTYNKSWSKWVEHPDIEKRW